MGDAHHLVLGSELPQHLADDLGDAPADARIHFVEDQRRHLRDPARHGLDCERDAGQLAAGGRLRERLRDHALVGGDEKFDVF
ncbi:hypothetical protein D3C83_107430 [compost metagenome]